MTIMFQTPVWNGGLCVMPGTHKNGDPKAAAGCKHGQCRAAACRDQLSIWETTKGIETIAMAAATI
jgi:hypothetical protein